MKNLETDKHFQFGADVGKAASEEWTRIENGTSDNLGLIPSPKTPMSLRDRQLFKAGFTLGALEGAKLSGNWKT
jgi:hypothetical protein